MLKTRFVSIVLCFALGLSMSLAASAAAVPPQQTDTFADITNDSQTAVSASTAPPAGTLPPVSAEAPAPQQSSNRDILLQVSNFYAVRSGERIRLTSGSGSLLTPFYDGSHAMIPLRILAETFGCSVTWEEITQSITVRRDGLSAVFSVGSAAASVNGQDTSLDAPVAVRGDAVYVAARALCQVLGCFIHYFDKNDGEFLLISDYPVSAGDLAGQKSTDFSSGAPDDGLLLFKTLGDEYLGPSRSMYERHTLTLMRNSTYAVWGGDAAAVTVPGASMVAPIRPADGNAYVPLDYCARCFGVQDESTAGAATLKFDGVNYITLQAFAGASGLYCVEYDPEVWVLSEYNLTKYDNLNSYAGDDAARLRALPTIRGYLALTYDDGPSGAVTSRLLDGLKERSVHATFFLCGDRIRRNPEPMSRYIAEGHELGNHSASHPNMAKLTSAEIGAEIDSTNDLIQEYTGYTPVLFRAPYGAYNQKVLNELHNRSLPCILWSDSFEDWKYRDSQPIINGILPHAGDGVIILLHDYYNASADAGLAVIDTLQAEGYKFVTVSDLAFIKGYTLSGGHVYCSIR
jgi:peptidoglycan/xylan/chitin deacetylase (PgdA/CDA1 family)